MKAFETTERIDLDRTFGFHRAGRFDPTATLEPGRFVKTFACAGGLVRHTIEASPTAVRFCVEGDDACWSTRLPFVDGYAAFAPHARHIALRHMVRELWGLRFVRVPWLFDLACSVILQQRVRYEEAVAEWTRIAERYGTHGPLGHAFPAAQQLARLTPPQLQTFGVDARRATTLIRFAREVVTHRILDEDTPAALAERLLSIPGIGPWTVGMLLSYGAGDRDAVPLGDLHLPRLVAQTFGDPRRPDDEHMLELLAPYAGERGRVTRLIVHASFSAPSLLHKR